MSVFGDQVEKRKVFAWLVEHAGSFKHCLSQNLSEMKTVPDVYFKETDMSATVDVISTIERLARDRSERLKGENEMEIDGLDFNFENETD